MNLKKYIIVSGFVLLVIFGLSLLSCGQKTGAVASKDLAPDFEVEDLKGNPFKLSSTRGKVVVLNFWSTGCRPCKEEMPQFEGLYNEYKDKGVLFVGVSLASPLDTSTFVKEKGLTFPIVTGTREVTSKYGGIQWIPTTFMIDRDGYIDKKLVGPQSTGAWKRDIEKLL
ncbi:peroxiredoxin family protein [Candidatus Omnitrophota bacterium]